MLSVHELPRELSDAHQSEQKIFSGQGNVPGARHQPRHVARHCARPSRTNADLVNRRGESPRPSLECVRVNEHADGSHDDPEVAPDAPVREIFEVGLDAIGEILACAGRAPEAAYLRETGDPRLYGSALPIAIIDIPEEIVLGSRARGVGPRPDDTHAPPNNVQQLRELIDAGMAEHRSDRGHALVEPAR